MTVTALRVAKSETRQLAEHDYSSASGSRLHEPTSWQMSTSAFFTAFVAIAAVLAVVALLVR
jgi:hypothetical protein